MLTSRKFAVCAALFAMGAFSMTGCCGGGGASLPFSQGSGQSCSSCGGGGGATYSTPSQAYSTSTPSYAQPQGVIGGGSGTVGAPTSQGFGGPSFGGGSGTVIAPPTQGFSTPSFGGGQGLPSFGGGSGTR